MSHPGGSRWLDMGAGDGETVRPILESVISFENKVYTEEERDSGDPSLSMPSFSEGINKVRSYLYGKTVTNISRVLSLRPALAAKVNSGSYPGCGHFSVISDGGVIFDCLKRNC